MASCLGASFSIKLLAIIVEESSTKNDSQREFPINLTFTEVDMDESSFDIIMSWKIFKRKVHGNVKQMTCAGLSTIKFR